MNKKQQKILKTLQEYDELNKQIKALYAERDLLEAWLLERLPVGTHLAYSPEEDVRVIDNFDNKNLMYGHGPVRRFEIVFVNKEKVAKAAIRAAKKASKEQAEDEA